MNLFKINRHHSENCGNDGKECKSFVVFFECKIIPERLDECIKLLIENRLEDTKKYEGCESIYGSVDRGESTILMWSRWSTLEHFNKYFQWRVDKGDFAELSAFFAEEPKVIKAESFF